MRRFRVRRENGAARVLQPHSHEERQSGVRGLLLQFVGHAGGGTKAIVRLHTEKLLHQCLQWMGWPSGRAAESIRGRKKVLPGIFVLVHFYFQPEQGCAESLTLSVGSQRDG